MTTYESNKISSTTESIVSDGQHRLLRPDLPIHRITDAERFIQMIESGELALVACSKWKDTHEGPLAQKVRTMSGLKEVDLLLKKRGIEFFTPIIMQLARHRTYMQCWTAAPEKKRMWREYSKNQRGVRFTTTLDKISKIAPFHIYNVEYREKLSLDEEIDEIFPNLHGLQVISMDQIFRRKLASYDYEEEIRIMYMYDVINAGDGKDGLGIKKFSFSHISDFIEAVTVDPRAEDNFLREIEDFCLLKGIHFLGRSTLELG